VQAIIIAAAKCDGKITRTG